MSAEHSHPGSAFGPHPSGELPKQYRPADHEPRIRERWEGSGAFHPDPARVLPDRSNAYCIFIPPPNVTDRLHLGHALNNSLQDILVRAHRMMGFETLWMPGTDHAGIATQAVVEKRLRKDGKLKGPLRESMKREDFVATVQSFKDEYEATITGQLKAMGCSCDWQRQRFTMDEQCAKAVYEAFFRLFKDGLIYRGKRLVNWDPVLQTAVADDECYDEEIDAEFFYLRYPLVHPHGSTTIRERRRHRPAPGDAVPVSWSELRARGWPAAEDAEHADDMPAWVTVATTRPETYLGDTAVAINPRDPRAKSLRGLFVELPLIGRVIPILEDDYVVLPAALQDDPDEAAKDPKARYATGFLKVTPAHDPNDYDIGQRHKAEIEAAGNAVLINIFAPDATISDKHGWSVAKEVAGAHMLVGLKRDEARKKVIAEFKAHTVSGDPAAPVLFARSVPYRHSVKHSDRSKAVIEPYLSDQWYVQVTDDRLRGSALRAMAAEQRSGGSAPSASAASSGGTGLQTGGFPSYPPSSSASLLSLSNLPTAINDPHFELSSPIDSFIPRDPYPPGQPSALDLLGSIRNLPHLELPDATYFVTWRAMPGQHLAEPERDLVLSALCHWHGDRCTLFAASVMPDHVHAIVRPRGDTSLGEWVASVKKFSSRAVHDHRRTSGTLWQDERFDHIVRDQGWLVAFLRYIVCNPVEDGLVDVPTAYRWLVVSEEVVARRRAQPPAASWHRSPERWSTGPTTSTSSSLAASVGSQSHSGTVAAGGRVGGVATGPETGATKGTAGDGALRFHPARYARTFETWHENIRDWCISRQLWWGHQIPVWFCEPLPFEPFNPGTVIEGGAFSSATERAIAGLRSLADSVGLSEAITFQQDARLDESRSSGSFLVCARSERAMHLLMLLEEYVRSTIPGHMDEDRAQRALGGISSQFPTARNHLGVRGHLVGFRRDPDVLDTWFSSALWPMSTLGWPDGHEEESDATRLNLLRAFNPSSVLCTAREIITLWVSRMVMFNRYFMGDATERDSEEARQRRSETARQGDREAATSESHSVPSSPRPLVPSSSAPLPFRDVFIHALIMDGSGQKMSKSLGNGVDPLDIIASHGADAMRFVLCQMTTQTQDVRMPVVKDPATGRNTSPKFDLGRNFCNKLWNAARFSLGILNSPDSSPAHLPTSSPAHSLPDRWILSRLAAAVESINASLRDYQFSDYAQAIYDLLWRDFCDWYLEAIKPTVAESPAQRAVLAHALESIVRLLHPIAPFVTEAIWERLKDVRTNAVPGITLGPSRVASLLCTAGWPEVSLSLRDEAAEREFERVRSLVTAIREVRAQHNVPPKRRIVLHLPAAIESTLREHAQLISTLAGLDRIDAIAPPAASASAPSGPKDVAQAGTSVSFTFESASATLSDLADAVDASAERARLEKVVADSTKAITTLEARLANPGYAQKAPPAMVLQTREQLAKAQAELAAAQESLARLPA